MSNRTAENIVSLAAVAVLCGNRARYFFTQRGANQPKAEDLKKRKVRWGDFATDVMLLDCLAFTPAVLGLARLLLGTKRLQTWWEEMLKRYSSTEIFRLYFIFTVVYYFGLGGKVIRLSVDLSHEVLRG